MQQFVLLQYKLFPLPMFSVKRISMDKTLDPRLDATRSQALDAALMLLQEKGVLAVTHGAINRGTGISRSTLYRHWPKLEDLRNAAFARAAIGPKNVPRTNGPLKTDLIWIIGHLMTALNDTPWGKIAPQVIAMAATEEQTSQLMSKWIEDRSGDVEAVFDAAKTRGELSEGAPVVQLVEMAIAIPYFRKLVAGQPAA
jgi:AcrR family transcriptional regulator